MSLLATIIGNRRRAFSPRDLAPALWLDASDPTTLLNGSAMATPDQAISQWSDKSGNGRHATQATGVSQPLRKTAIQNGRDVVRFDGVNDSLTVAVPVSRDAFSCFSVVRKISGDASDFRVALGWGTGTKATLWHGWMQATARKTVSMSDGLLDLFGVTGAGPSLFSSVVKGPTSRSVEGWVDGVYLGSASEGRVTRPGDVLTLGNYSTGSFFLNGDIAEILVYPTALSDSDRQMVEAYVKAKWNTP